mmetsp:Transcript_17127/g.33655  ORF Transcript_17127/g.33655 Transcript_17127/m.33655 type:complete len:94 (+) Transcript_17127:228-509(+)
MRKIHQGEELISDYGEQYWRIVSQRMQEDHMEYWAKVQPRCAAIIDLLGPDAAAKAYPKGPECHPDFGSPEYFDVNFEPSAQPSSRARASGSS